MTIIISIIEGFWNGSNYVLSVRKKRHSRCLMNFRSSGDSVHISPNSFEK